MVYLDFFVAAAEIVAPIVALVAKRKTKMRYVEHPLVLCLSNLVAVATAQKAAMSIATVLVLNYLH